MWHDMFVAGVPLLERVFRSIIVYVFAIVALRLAGKRELGQYSTLDLVVLLFFSNILQNSVIGNDNSVTGGVVGAATFLGINWLVVKAIYRYDRIKTIVEGTETYLMRDGVIDEKALWHEGVDEEDLLEAAHKQGILNLGDVHNIILEPDGSLTIIGKSPSGEEEFQQDLLRRIDALQESLRQVSLRVGVPEPGTDAG
ncbi:MAG TPA: YetF domain-containing protein [Thermomicrobiaceae bacterium]|nr:YetF domain-containing protein [Thermomicrobiaceae bacterium]